MRGVFTFFRVCLTTGLIWTAGCQTDKLTNPSFPLSVADAKSDLKRMTGQPKPLARPVLALGGFVDPGFAADDLARRIRQHTGDDRVISVAFAFASTFDDCSDRIIQQLEKAFPSDRANETIEVDVVAVSMGGLAARWAAAPAAKPSVESTSGDAPRTRQQKRLRIARLFTISTPHRGAKLATLPTLEQTQIDMRAGSTFLEQLNDALASAEYELFTYVRLEDAIVGADNAAPPGRTPWWVPNRLMQGAHLFASTDPRILADILRRLRNETPCANDPPAPLPP